MTLHTNPHGDKTMTTTKFAAIESGACHHHNAVGVVYGIGLTPGEAIADAREVSCDPDSEYDVIAITDAAFEEVQKFGGSPGDVSVNTHDRIIRTHTEEAAAARIS
jgi:hypothetical protein